MTQLVIAIPSGDTWQAKTGQAISNLVGWTSAHGDGLTLGMINRQASMLTGSRNDIVSMALKNGADWMLWIDSDMVFPASSAMRLLEHGKPIVGATYNKRVYPYETLGRFIPPADGSTPTSGLVGAHYMPGGMMLISTDVYKRVPYPWYFETYQPEGSAVDSFIARMQDMLYKPLPGAMIGDLRELWSTYIESEYAERTRICGDARTMSEDYNFCRKARAFGYSIWCDLDLTHEMGHVGTQIVTTMPTGAKGAIPHFYQTIQGWFTGAALHLYQHMVAEAPDGAHFVEVGTWKGKSAAFMAVEIANSGKRIRFDTIDHFRGSNEPAHMADREIAVAGLKAVALSNLGRVSAFVNVIEDESPAASARYADESLEFVRIDGDHEYESVCADIDAWLPKIRPGGVLAGDDFNWPGVQKAVRERFPNARIDDTQWIAAVPEHDRSATIDPSSIVEAAE